MLLHRQPHAASCVYTANSFLRLKVAVDEQNMSPLNVNKGRRNVGLARGFASTHDILDALVHQSGGHDHAIGLTVIGNQFEDCSCGHSVELTPINLLV